MKFPRVRLTVRRAMALVTMTAVGLAVARHVVAHWGTREATTVAPIVLVATNVLAWFQKARWQVFWIGFGLCGWAYWTLALGSPLAEDLPTAWLLDGLHDRLYADALPPAYDIGFDEGPVYAQAHGAAFRRAGQSLLSLLFGLPGGCVAIVLFPAKAEDGAAGPPDGSLLRPGWRDVTSGAP